MSPVFNIAHRGFHKNFPANTLEAFEAAIQLGVDGIELDVRETSDRGFIVFHDPKIGGTDITKLSLEHIKSIKLKDKFEIPTLEQVLELCRKRTKLLVELKKAQSLDKFLELLEAKVEPNDVTVISFDKDIISELWFLAPEVQKGSITALPLVDPVKLAQSLHCNSIVVKFPFVNERLVEKARLQNLSIFVWGCHDMKAVRNMLRLDIDGLISDFPDQVQAALG
jgi:glycerophosphoryl diester phosphodiesterase